MGKLDCSNLDCPLNKKALCGPKMIEDQYQRRLARIGRLPFLKRLMCGAELRTRVQNRYLKDLKDLKERGKLKAALIKLNAARNQT